MLNLLALLMDAAWTQTTDGGAADAIPWPFQLGLNGVTLGALVAFFLWFNRQVVGGKLYPGTIVADMLAQKDKTITGLTVLDAEHRSTIKTLESTNATLAEAVEQATSNQQLVNLAVDKAFKELGSPEGPSKVVPK